jgi:hypothetical protein
MSDPLIQKVSTNLSKTAATTAVTSIPAPATARRISVPATATASRATSNIRYWKHFHDVAGMYFTYLSSGLPSRTVLSHVQPTFYSTDPIVFHVSLLLLDEASAGEQVAFYLQYNRLAPINASNILTLTYYILYIYIYICN